MSHSHGLYMDGKWNEFCHNCYLGRTPQKVNAYNLDKLGRRLSHWKDIKTRVRTHEGELLSGKQGLEYQKKFSKKYLGRDLYLTKPLNRSIIEEYNYRQKQ